ncbi:pseudouridine synthase [Capsaspora owczarzaki ATCC 30864]|nr:pseudouridine synthase [Capsaspora owczarzaki ATCC 30864]|eukprot:XP_004363420.1 pseudouridine synthase [Capsaspora owczarzaki ATCC 30864]
MLAATPAASPAVAAAAAAPSCWLHSVVGAAGLGARFASTSAPSPFGPRVGRRPTPTKHHHSQSRSGDRDRSRMSAGAAREDVRIDRSLNASPAKPENRFRRRLRERNEAQNDDNDDATSSRYSDRDRFGARNAASSRHDERSLRTPSAESSNRVERSRAKYLPGRAVQPPRTPERRGAHDEEDRPAFRNQNKSRPAYISPSHQPYTARKGEVSRSDPVVQKPPKVVTNIVNKNAALYAEHRESWGSARDWNRRSSSAAAADTPARTGRQKIVQSGPASARFNEDRFLVSSSSRQTDSKAPKSTASHTANSPQKRSGRDTFSRDPVEEVVDADVDVNEVPIGAQSPPRPAPRPITDAERDRIRQCVLHKDQHIIVINKPAGLSVMADGFEALDLSRLLPALQFEAPCLPHIVHRLDKNTTGALLLARNPRVARILSRAFQKQRIGKTYTAIVAGAPPFDSGIINCPLEVISATTARKVGVTPGTVLCRHDLVYANETSYLRTRRDALSAITHFSVVGRSSRGPAALIEFVPMSGRKHQLRVHSSKYLGHPILGDNRYGNGCPVELHEPLGIAGWDAKNDVVKLQLHARSIVVPSLDQQRNNKPLVVLAPLPAHMKEVMDKLQMTESSLHEHEMHGSVTKPPRIVREPDGRLHAVNDALKKRNKAQERKERMRQMKLSAIYARMDERKAAVRASRPKKQPRTTARRRPFPSSSSSAIVSRPAGTKRKRGAATMKNLVAAGKRGARKSKQL